MLTVWSHLVLVKSFSSKHERWSAVKLLSGKKFVSKATVRLFPVFSVLQPFTCVNMKTSSLQWRSTLCSPSALQWAGPSARARGRSSSWNPWRVWALSSSSSTKIWLWRSSPSTRQRTAAWSRRISHCTGESHHRVRALWSFFLFLFLIPFNQFRFPVSFQVGRKSAHVHRDGSAYPGAPALDVQCV